MTDDALTLMTAACATTFPKMALKADSTYYFFSGFMAQKALPFYPYATLTNCTTRANVTLGCFIVGWRSANAPTNDTFGYFGSQVGGNQNTFAVKQPTLAFAGQDTVLGLPVNATGLPVFALVAFGKRGRRTTPVVIHSLTSTDLHRDGSENAFRTAITFSAPGGPCAMNVTGADGSGYGLTLGYQMTGASGGLVEVSAPWDTALFTMTVTCPAGSAEQNYTYARTDVCKPPDSNYDIYGQIKYSWCEYVEWRMIIVLVLIVLAVALLRILFWALYGMVVFFTFVWYGVKGVKSIWQFIKAIGRAIWKLLIWIGTGVMKAGAPDKKLLMALMAVGVWGHPFVTQEAALPGTGCLPGEISQILHLSPQLATGIYPIAESTTMNCDGSGGEYTDCTMNTLLAARLAGSYGATMIVAITNGTVNGTVVPVTPVRYIIAPIRTTTQIVFQNSYVTYMDYKVNTYAWLTCGSETSTDPGWPWCANPYAEWCAMTWANNPPNASFQWGDVATCECADCCVGACYDFGDEDYHHLHCANFVVPADFDDFWVVGTVRVSAPTMRFFIGEIGEDGNVSSYMCADAPVGQTTQLTSPDGTFEVVINDFEVDPGSPAGQSFDGIWHAGKNTTTPGDIFTGPVSYFGQGKMNTVGHMQWLHQPRHWLDTPLKPADGWAVQANYWDVGCSGSYSWVREPSLRIRPYTNLSAMFPEIAITDFNITTDPEVLPKVSAELSSLHGPGFQATMKFSAHPVVWNPAPVCPKIKNISVIGCSNCGVRAEITVTLLSECSPGFTRLLVTGSFTESVSGGCVIQTTASACKLYAYIVDNSGHLTVTANAKTTDSLDADYDNWEDDRIPWNGGADNETEIMNSPGGDIDFWDAFGFLGSFTDAFKDLADMIGLGGFGDFISGMLMLIIIVIMFCAGVALVFMIVRAAIAYWRGRSKKATEKKAQEQDTRNVLSRWWDETKKQLPGYGPYQAWKTRRAEARRRAEEEDLHRKR